MRSSPVAGPAAAPTVWGDVARDLVSWAKPWDTLWSPQPPFGRWFDGGTLRPTETCLERHLPDRGGKPALLWEGEPGDRRVLSYAELHDEVLSLDRALRAMGVGRDDRVALHLGSVPETVVAMLACARIGALCTVVPTPLHTDALVERLLEFSPRVLFTQDGAWRRGTVLPLKERADEALTAVGDIEHTVVVRRTGLRVNWYEGDRWYHELVAATPAAGAAPAEPLPAGQPLISAPLATRNERPISVTLSASNVLVSAAAVHRYGIGGGGVCWLPGDASWLATQVHGVYGPLCAGDTLVMFEGTLDVPDHTRAWRIVDRYAVDTLLLSPSLVRRLKEWSADLDEDERRLPTLRRCVTLGEQRSPDLVEWMAAEWGTGEVSVADAWGQTELGGIVNVDQPAHPELLPDPGLEVVDSRGRKLAAGRTGELVLRRPWPGMATAVSGEAAADVVEYHLGRYPGLYATGDRAVRDGRTIRFLGRTDPVVSISGHLVSLTEIRGILLAHPFVRLAEVVEYEQPGRGHALLAAVVLDPDVQGATGVDSVAGEILDDVRATLGGLARPRALVVLDRFGDELTATDRRAALARLAGTLGIGESSVTTELSWSQVLAAAGHRRR